MLRQKCSALILLLCPIVSLGQQLIPIPNNGEGVAQIAKGGLNRIYIEDDKIVQIASLNGELMIQKDLENGQLFVKPIDEHREKPIEIFLSTEKGNNFALSLKPLTIKAQNIGVSKQEKESKADKEEEKLLSIIKEMQQKKVDVNYKNTGYEDKALSSVPYKVIQKEIIHRGEFVGEIYVVANGKEKSIKIEHTPFWRKGVKAVVTEKNTLLAGEATHVYVVKKYGV